MGIKHIVLGLLTGFLISLLASLFLQSKKDSSAAIQAVECGINLENLERCLFCVTQKSLEDAYRTAQLIEERARILNPPYTEDPYDMETVQKYIIEHFK